MLDMFCRRSALGTSDMFAASGSVSMIWLPLAQALVETDKQIKAEEIEAT